ncbi:MAG: phage tail assembly protein [Alphaproteobacteria bacterium]
MKAKTITLKRPIEAHGKEVTELTFREPTLGVLDGLEIEVTGDGGVKLNLGDIVKLVASMAEIPPSSARQIALSDLKEIAGEVQDFFEQFLPAGGS